MTEVFAIQCYLNGKRKFTAKLTRREAKVFRHAARTLDKFLTEKYSLEKKK